MLLKVSLDDCSKCENHVGLDENCGMKFVICKLRHHEGYYKFTDDEVYCPKAITTEYSEKMI